MIEPINPIASTPFIFNPPLPPDPREDAPMTDAEQLENAKAAFGEHPDSDVDLATRISELRDSDRAKFHALTQLADCHARPGTTQEACGICMTCKDRQIQRLNDDYARLETQLCLCQEHAALLARDFESSVVVARGINDKARESLQKYGDHMDSCDHVTTHEWQCTCGFTASLEANK